MENWGSELTILEEVSTLRILSYLLDHDQCRKSDIYRDIGRTPSIPDKLNKLEDVGLLDITRLDRQFSITISLTDQGRIVASHIREIHKILAGKDEI